MAPLLFLGLLSAAAAMAVLLRRRTRQRRRRTSLEAAGLRAEPGPPDLHFALDRLSLHPEPVLWHARISRPLDAWICCLPSGPIVVWRSARGTPGALAVRPHTGEAFALQLARGRYRRLVLLLASSLPDPYDRLDVYLEPAAARAFLETGLADACLELIERDLPMTFEYQDGACRLRLDRLAFESPADYDTTASAAAGVEAGLARATDVLAAQGRYRIEIESAAARVLIARLVVVDSTS